MAQHNPILTVPQIKCPLCCQLQLIVSSKGGRQMIKCVDCKIVYMPELDSMCYNGQWVSHPIIRSSQPAIGQCPVCNKECFLQLSRSEKNKDRAYLKCVACDIFQFEDANYYLKSGTFTSLPQKPKPGKSAPVKFGFPNAPIHSDTKSWSTN